MRERAKVAGNRTGIADIVAEEFLKTRDIGPSGIQRQCSREVDAGRPSSVLGVNGKSEEWKCERKKRNDSGAVHAHIIAPTFHVMYGECV